MCTGDLFEARFLAIPRARCLLGHSYPLPSRTELSCGPLCGRLGLPGWAGTLRPGAPGGAGVPKPQPRPLLSGRRRQPERRRRRRGVPRARLTCGRREGRSRAFLHRDPSFLPAAHPGACTQQPPPARRPVPERGATGAPPTLAPALLCALLLLPPAARGAGAGRPPHPPTPGRARREGGDCGEGGAPPASRGLERAWPGSRRRRAGTRLAPLGARAAQRMLAGCPGLGPLSRPGGPRVRP